MALTPEEIKQLSGNFLQKQETRWQKPPSFGVPKEREQGLDQQINSMPNADKLTKFERWTYGKLPGVTTWMENHRIMGNTVSEQLEKFNNGWLGKALNTLDVFAEGLERTVGLAGQLNDPGFDVTKDLKAAWYAGSLTYDTANLPTIKRDKQGNIIGLTVPTDLPGSGGVSQARVRIQALVDEGMGYKEAKDKAMDELYGGLGALALRSQMNDMLGHFIADPLNILTAYLKPIQALKARRFAALGQKISYGTEEIITKADEIARLAKTAGNAEDALKYADEAFQLAQMVGDTKLASKYADEAVGFAKSLEDSARKAGKLTEAEKYAADISRFSDETARFAGMGADEAAEFSESALRVLGKKQITSLDKVAIMLGGGDPFRPSRLGKALEKVPVAGFIAKQFKLTPASKAQELVKLVTDNIGTNIISRIINDPNAEAEFVSYIRRVSKGATGIEYGHSMATLEGRTVQAFTKGVDMDIERLFTDYQKLAPSRGRLELLSQTLGESPSKLLSKMDENPEAILAALAKHAPENPSIALALQNGEFTADSIKGLAKTLEGVPHNKEMFFAQAMDAIETLAMRQAVIQFGVKSKGVVTRWSEALKAAESLAFLKLNPAYPIRNAINNEVTMIARGVFGVFGPGDIDNFWSDFGYVPSRLEEALTPAQELAKRGEKVSEAQRILEDALRGGEWGAPDKAKEFFQKLNLGKLDSTKLGFNGKTFEQMAGRRAMTVGTQQGLDMFLPEVRIQNHLAQNLLEEMDNAVPGLSSKINGAIRSSNGSANKFKDIMGQNLNVSVDNILDDVTAKLGTDVREMLGTEVVTTLKNKLPEALQKGTPDALKTEIRQLINKKIDDDFLKQVENLVEHTKAQAVAGGPNVWNMKMLETREMFYGARIEHSIRMPDAVKAAREAAQTGNYKVADALWRQEAEDSRLFFDRTFRRVDAIIDGLEQGTQELAKRGVKLPFAETKKTFRQFKEGWENFYNTKNKMFEDYWSLPKDKRPPWDEFHGKVERMYYDQTLKEQELTQRLDDTISAMIDNPQTKQAYINARDALAEMDRVDKEIVTSMFESVNKLPPEERQPAWLAFWQERQTRLQEMRRVDAASIMIQQGDEAATQAFAQAQSTSRTLTRPITPEIIKTPEFKNWFGDSKVVDESGKPLVVYHGSKTKGIEVFETNKPSKLTGEVGAYFTPQKDYALQYGEEIYPAYVSLKNPFIAETKPTEAGQKFGFFTEKAKQGLIAQGYDGIITKPGGKIEEVVAFYPEQIKHAAEGGAQTIAKTPQGVTPQFIADVKKVVPDMAPMDFSEDLMAYGRIYGTLDEVVDGAKIAAKKTPMILDDLPPALKTQAIRALEGAENELAGVRYKAMKFGEWRRDSALLNYNRRTNFDNNLAHIAPFAFWSTSSMMQWAIESIDRPAMLTNYLRVKKFMETAGLQRDGMPSRTKGKIRVNLPFAPDWMGEQFVDPLRVALPFDNWLSPFDQFKKDQMGANGRTQRVLDQLLKEGKIEQDEYDQAIADQNGAVWDYAEGIMQQNDQTDRYDAWDFASTMAAPHAPIMWAYNAAFGDKEDIGPFSPLSRITRNAATMLGVEDWNNSKYNLEAKVRRQMGLEAYDKWDDYRVDRALSDLAGDGSYTPDEVKEALAISALVQKGDMTPEQAKQASEAYREGVKRSNQEFTGGLTAFGLGLLGMSVTSVPKGELELRRLQDDFGKAYEKYKGANDSLETFLADHANMPEEEAAALWEKQNPKLAKDGDALTQFFNDHPEYETRLGLFDTPEEKHHKFMIDQVWKRYNELPTLNQNEVRDALGADFQEAFLSKETRSYDDVPVELMAVWLKLMGTDPLGGLTADQRILASLYGKVQMTDPETANRVQVFYDTRKQRFDDFYDLQNGYYEIQSKSERKKYLSQHPELKTYWDWRRTFMIDNPDLVPYLTDNEKAIAEAKRRTRTQQAVPTAQELQVNLTPQMNELLAYYNQTGAPIPQVVLNELDFYGQGYGMTGEQLLNVYNAGQFGDR